MRFTKDTGPKPSKVALDEASNFARPSTGDHMAVAMAMRPNGATQAEIVALLGHPHRNKLNGLIDSKKLKRVILPDTSRSTRIKLVK